MFDAFEKHRICWHGRLEEIEFLSRVFEMSDIPSTDRRHQDAEGDIIQHRIANHDWDDDWIFYDDRFELLNGEDDILLRFLCETLHPAVRPDVTEVEQLAKIFNDILRNDGFQLVEAKRMSGKPVFIGSYTGVATIPGIELARAALLGADAGYVCTQITRMESAIINEDPGLAIGTAKELVETCCRTILAERCVQIPANPKLTQLVKLASQELELTPDHIDDKAKAADTIKVLLSNLAAITQGISELRNKYGTGHGKESSTKGLTSRHAKLAVGAASTLAVFLSETHLVRRSLE